MERREQLLHRSKLKNRRKKKEEIYEPKTMFDPPLHTHYFFCLPKFLRVKIEH